MALLAILALHIHPAVLDAIVRHARDEAPSECCGLLVGSGSLIDEAVRTRNLDPNPTTRYLVDPAAHIALNRRLRGTSRALVGCYHSHPDGPALPSATDLREALYPEFVWLIVSLAGPGPELAAFRLSEEGFTPIAWRPVDSEQGRRAER